MTLSFGDAITDPSQVTTTGAPKTMDPVSFLKAHLNRFTNESGAQAPIATTNLPINSTLDATTATRAVTILGMRAGAASKIYTDQATKDLLKTVGQAYANPIAYVQKNLAMITDVVRRFGDTYGYPAAKGVPQLDVLPFKIPTWGYVAAAGLAYALLKKRRGR